MLQLRGDITGPFDHNKWKVESTLRILVETRRSCDQIKDIGIDCSLRTRYYSIGGEAPLADPHKISPITEVQLLNGKLTVLERIDRHRDIALKLRVTIDCREVVGKVHHACIVCGFCEIA